MHDHFVPPALGGTITPHAQHDTKSCIVQIDKCNDSRSTLCSHGDSRWSDEVILLTKREAEFS